MALATDHVVDRSAGVCAADGEALGNTGSQVAYAQGDEFVVGVYRVAVPGGKAACGKHGAAEADGGDTQGVAQQAFHFRQVAVRPDQLRDAGRYRAENGNAEAVRAEQADQQHEQRHYRQRRRQAGVAPWQPDQQAQCGEADEQRHPVDFTQALEEVDQAEDEAVTLDLESHHLGQLPGDQAQADAVEIADQDRAREEAGDEPGPGHAGRDQHYPDQ